MRNGTIFDPRTSPYFSPQDNGDGMVQLGDGSGMGWLDWSQVPGFENMAQNALSAQQSVSGIGYGPSLLDSLTSQGYQLYEAPEADRWVTRGVVDAQGNFVGEPQRFQLDDDRGFWNAALAAGLVTGANIGAAQGAFSGAESAAGGGGGGALSSADKAALFGDAGYGAGMTGAQTGAAGGVAAGGSSGGGMGSTLSDFFSGNGSFNDYLRAGQTLAGLYANNKAADAAQEGEQARNALLMQMYQDTRKDNQPLVDLRNSVLPKISALVNDPSSVANEPGYQFGLKQGQSQIDNSMAARGGYYSGQQLKASQKFGQDYATGKLDQSINRLMGVAGLGQIGSNSNANANQNFGQQSGNSLANQGNIRGSGYLGGFNTINNGINSWVQDDFWRQAIGGGK